jgi:hypothetical protein
MVSPPENSWLSKVAIHYETTDTHGLTQIEKDAGFMIQDSNQ